MPGEACRCGIGEGGFGWPVGLHQLAWGLPPHHWDTQRALLHKKVTKIVLGGTSPVTVSFSLAAWARCEHRVQETVSTKALQARDTGTVQQCPADHHPSETPLYKSAAAQLGGERCALSSATVKVSFVCIYTYTLPLTPSCCHGATVSSTGSR